MKLLLVVAPKAESIEMTTTTISRQFHGSEKERARSEETQEGGRRKKGSEG